MDQTSSQGAPSEATNAQLSQVSARSVISQVGWQPLPPSDSSETRQTAASERAQGEQASEQEQSNAPEQFLVLVDKTSRTATTDLDESLAPLRIRRVMKQMRSDKTSKRKYENVLHKKKKEKKRGRKRTEKAQKERSQRKGNERKGEKERS